MPHETLPSLSRDARRQIDAACDRFEQEWKQGHTPNIFEYLAQASGGARTILFQELLTLEIHYRCRSSRPPSKDDYLSVFPEYAQLIDSVWDEHVTHDSPPVSDVVLATVDADSPGLSVRCPHCHESTRIAAETNATDMTCCTCGGNFSLLGDESETRQADAISQLGHFELIQRIGMGGMGTVWKARDTILDRTVAVKIPRQDRLGPNEAEKLLREARAAAQLQHPNIVRVYEVGRHDESIYIVSDFLRGVPLNEWLSARSPTNREAASLLRKIAEAAHHAHEHGVVHRDLKPQNIMMDYDGQPHITDFGLAKRLSGEVTMTIEGHPMGTPAYMSPEQARGEAHQADRRADIYALGVIFFELLTGELPFRGSTDMIVYQVANDEVPSPRRLNPRLPRDLETICLKCLQKDPARRYQTAEALALELDRYLRGEPIQARPVGHVARAWRWCRRKPAIASLSAALALIVLLLAIVSPIVAARQALLRRNAQQLADEKSDALELATQREAEAQRNFMTAYQQVDDFFVSVSESPDLLRGTPGMQKLRQDLLEKARGYYSQFVQEHSDDEKLANQLGWAHFRLAILADEVGERQESERHYENAIATFNKVAEQDEENVGIRNALATTYINLSGLYAKQGRHAEEFQALEKSTQLVRGLVEQFPQNDNYLSMLAQAHTRNAIYHRTRGKVDIAIDEHEKALDVRDELVSRNPKLYRDRYRLVWDLRELGYTYRDLKKDDAQAIAKIEEAYENMVSLMKTAPNKRENENLLAQLAEDLATLYQRQGALEKALAKSDESLAIREKLFQQNPDVPLYRHGFLRVCNRKTSVLATMGRHLDAAASQQVRCVTETQYRGLFARCPSARLVALAATRSAWSSDGSRLIVQRALGRGLRLLHLSATSSQVQAFDLAPGARQPTWRPRSDDIAFVEAIEDVGYIRVARIDNEEQTSRRVVPGSLPTWSQLGDTLFFHNTQQLSAQCVSRVLVPNLFGPFATIVELPPLDLSTRQFHSPPAISPLGDKIAWRGGSTLHIVDVESNHRIIQWPLPKFRDLHAAWSPDGEALALGGLGQPDGVGLWILDLQTKRIKRVVPGPYTLPAWSPDGTRLSFARNVQHGEVWVVQLSDIQNSPEYTANEFLSIFKK